LAAPGRFLEEPLPEGSGSSSGSLLELEAMLDEYYQARGWDVGTGLPTHEKLAELGLEGPERGDAEHREGEGNACTS